MSFHAYSKRQFYALNFDTTPYRKLTGDDSGTACARLDCKRWGAHCMFLYLTLDRGCKVFAPVFQQNPTGIPYLGFADIPIGAIVDIDIDGEIHGDKAWLIYAEWLPDETDPAEAMAKQLGVDPHGYCLSCGVASIGFVLTKPERLKPKGTLPL